MSFSEWTEALKNSMYRVLDGTAEYLPTLAGALVLILVGWVIARLLRAICLRLMKGLNWLLGARSIENVLKRLGVDRTASEVLGAIIFWAVLLFFLTAATEALGLPVLATWVSGLTHYLPRILVAVLIGFAGVVAAGVARDAIQATVTAAGIPYAAPIARAAHAVILLITIVTAVEQIGIDTGFLTANLTILIGAIVAGAALAFGLGARTSVSNVIAGHYIRQTYAVGQRIKIAGAEGSIAKITSTAVVLEAPGERITVPAKQFSESASVLLTAAGG